MRAGFTSIIDHQGFDPLCQGRNKCIVNPGRHNETGGCGASLSSGEKRTIDGAFHGDLQIGIVKHNERILATHFELEFRHARETSGRDFLTRRNRSGEGDGVDIAVVEEGLTNNRAASHH